MKFVDYYKVLEIEPNADQITIKKAYKKLASKWHPDKNKEDTTKMMQLLNEAKDVLLDDSAKAKYDREYSNYKAYKSTNSDSSKKASNVWEDFKETVKDDYTNERNSWDTEEYEDFDEYYDDEPFWNNYSDSGYRFRDLLLVKIIKKIRSKIWNVAKETLYIAEAGLDAAGEEAKDWFKGFWGYLLIISIVLSIIMAMMK